MNPLAMILLVGGLHVTFAWSAWVSTTIPTDGTDRIVSLTFTGKTTAGTLSVAAIEVEEYQT